MVTETPATQQFRRPLHNPENNNPIVQYLVTEQVKFPNSKAVSILTTHATCTLYSSGQHSFLKSYTETIKD
jgi:hypothetical protein